MGEIRRPTVNLVERKFYEIKLRQLSDEGTTSPVHQPRLIDEWKTTTESREILRDRYARNRARIFRERGVAIPRFSSMFPIGRRTIAGE